MVIRMVVSRATKVSSATAAVELKSVLDGFRDIVTRAEIFQEAGVFLIGAVNDNGGGFPCDGEGDGRVPEGS